MTAPFFSRARIVAAPGWNRWLVPPAALSIHLSVGAAYSWSVFKKPLEGALGISGTLSALPFTIGIVMLGLSAAVFGTWVDRNGPAHGDVRGDVLFLRWMVGGLGRAGHAAILAGVARLRRARWNRLGHRVHLTRLDADQMVPRQAGHGDGAGDHGIRRWRTDRVAVVDRRCSPTSAAIRRVSPRRSWCTAWPTRCSCRGLAAGESAEAGLEAARMDAVGADGGVARLRRSGLGQQRDQDAAVLVAVGSVVLQRDCRNRHPREGLAGLPGLFPGECRGRRARRGGRRLRGLPVAGATCWAGSAGPACPTGSAARTPTGCTSASGPCCTSRSR